MKSKAAIGGLSKSWLLLGAAALFSGMVSPALAQTQTEEEEVVVTGYRASLESSTEAKREATAVVDSVFAEDIGRFPDLTIAESLNRIPGVQIARDINGEGVLIAVRGLGTNFTKIMLNGAQIAVASSGTTDGQNQNREVDLSIFPTELFTRLDVQKTPTAGMLEGGVAGIVNMRAARPFDYDESQITYQFQGNYGESSEEVSPRAAVLASGRWDTRWGEIGVLGGVAAVYNRFVTEGFETIGWTNPNLSDAQCGAAGFDHDSNPATGAQNICNIVPNPGFNPALPPSISNPEFATSGNGWVIPGTVPAGAGAGLVTGTTIDAAFLTANNSGLSAEDIGHMLLPRLGRLSHTDGDRDRVAAVLGLQWRPSNSAEFWLDIMATEVDRQFSRIDMNWVGRNGAFIPLDVVLDSNGVVTSGTFANAQWFLEARPYHETMEFLSINPGATFDIGDNMQWNINVNYTRSNFFREAPTILVNTPLGVGTIVDYANPGSPYPDILTNVDLNDPASGWTWAGGRVNIQNEKRVTYTEGLHTDYRWGDSANNVRVGLAWDDIGRTISARDNSAAWEDIVCRSGGDPDGAGPQPRPACVGGAGSAILQSNLASYLLPGPLGFITVDYDRFFNDSNYHALSAAAPEANSSATGAATGRIFEATWGLWIEANGDFDLLDRRFRYNVGVRQVETDQVIQGPVTIAGVRQYQTLDNTYDETLPSLNAAYDIMEGVMLRFAASRTLTRPNPSVMLPNTNFSDPSAQNATQGNPTLAPFISDNIDLGGEWYTGGEGYIGVMLFHRELTGFTVNGIRSIPFSELGVPFDSLTPTQQAAINAGGGPATWIVNLQQQVNADGVLTIDGYELTWVQPLDVLFEGLGFSANYTNVEQESDGVGVPAKAIGISPYTYNFTGYFERGPFSIRASYTFQDEQVISGANQNGIPTAELFADARGQWDLSSSFTFEHLPTSPQIVLNVTNLTSEPLRTWFQHPNATFTYYEPGYNVLLGIRGTF